MAARPGVTCGIDRLLDDPERWLRGRRFGLVTNSAARGACGTPGFLLLRNRCGTRLAALFVPEHGLDAAVADGEPVPDGMIAGAPPGCAGEAGGRCAADTMPPVHSLYALDRRRPSLRMLADLELLVIDLQDIGVRYYTYVSTMVECLHAAAAAGLPVLVLDRPNPLGGIAVEGPRPRKGYRSFVGALDVPVRHGLTMGELCLVAAKEQGLDDAGAHIEVVGMSGWRRAMQWGDTFLTWHPPSPAARSLNMISLYPGTCLLEGTNVSEGRGTDAPFELIGAPWLDGDALAGVLNRSRALGPGWWPAATPASFTPQSGKYAGEPCRGVRLEAPAAWRKPGGPASGPHKAAGEGGGPVAFGVALLSILRRLGGERFAWRRAGGAEGQGDRYWVDVLTGGPEVRTALDDGDSWSDIAARWQPGEDAHRERSAGFLLYGREEWYPGRRPVRGDGAATGARPEAALDLMSPSELAAHLVARPGAAVAALQGAVPQIARAIDLAARRLARGGRLIYVGAGTSGRLGVLDASECEPTFGVAPGRVIAIVAGGSGAVAGPREGAEDDAAAAVSDLDGAQCTGDDVVVCTAASGATPYTLAALREARRRGALGVAVVGREGSPMAAQADVAIEVPTGEEPLRGSTRLLAGTAHKVVLNAISTGIFSRLGLVYGDRMVGVQVSNAKLRARAEGLVAELAAVSRERAAEALRLAMEVDRRLAVRLAVLSLAVPCSMPEALARLASAGESLRRALEAAGCAVPPRSRQ